MKISIIGGGNMGGSIAYGLATSGKFIPQNISVIDVSTLNISVIKENCKDINAVVSDYSSLETADIVIIAVKPWMVEEVIKTYKHLLDSCNQLLVSVAAGISLNHLQEWSSPQKPVFRVVPNTAIAVKQSMTFIASKNASKEQEEQVLDIFSLLGQADMINEELIPAVTSLTSCGIAFAFRYIRASMEGGVEMGLYPNQAKKAIIQTLRGAIDLLETNGTHPEVEIDKVTTAGGITIKGLNEMEHAGFTSAVIRGLKASNVK